MPDRHIGRELVSLGVESAAAQFGDVLLDARAGDYALAERDFQAPADQLVSLEIIVAARGRAGCGVHDGIDDMNMGGAQRP